MCFDIGNMTVPVDKRSVALDTCRLRLAQSLFLAFSTVYVTTVVSSEVGHVTIFQRSGTCVCGEGTSRIFGPKATSAVMLSQWENGALLFVWILTISDRIISKIQYDSESPINSVYESVGFIEKT